jgi:class 3 adenylate cyclase/tetratricopeptide (TPR) repeat protein
VYCPNCGRENRPGAKFCVSCGTALALACPNCGNAADAGQAFCAECGTALTGGPPAALAGPGPGLAPPVPAGPTFDPSSPVYPSGPISRAPSRDPLGEAQPDTPAGPAPPSSGTDGHQALHEAPIAERRHVTVLFADLVGFTTLSEGRDAEETRELLSRYFDHSREVIERYGGVVEKFIGDAVMAVWGAPTAREDDPERAVRAALDLVDSVRSLGPGILARAGVLTGEAAITLGAAGQGMVAGDLVNTASRLQSIAAPGTVLVGETTQHASAKSVVFEPAGEQLLKGKTAPVPAFRAVRIVAERGGRGRADTLEAPFVGRQEEVRLLKDLYHATAREKRTRLVSVTGQAGIGKSRLAWEFEKYLDGLVEKVRWHHGRSPAYGTGLTFWALGEMVRGRAKLAEGDDERTTRERIAATLAEHVADESDRRWIEPALLTLLGIREATAGGRDELFAAWRTFFERIATTGPVVMVFEDLQWADTGLLDFIDHLLEWTKSVPIYVVTLARPELLERRADWGAGRRQFTSIYLEPLSEVEMRDLLAGLVPGLPAPAVAAIVGRADGIPLYAVETVRMLVAEGRLREENGAYVPAGDLTSLAVPESLQALIAARLDALDQADRSLLSGAAVLGQSFTPAGLAAVAGIDQTSLEPRLRLLARRELLTYDADPRSPERGQYAFVQALIREVAYNTLAKRDRRSRHLAAARYFESLGEGELAGALAEHYLAAYRNTAGGPEADALAVQARIALKAAAERAASLGSHDQAGSFLEQALEVSDDPAEQAELLERAGATASAAGHHERAERHLRRALELQSERGDRSAVARATATLGRVLLNGRRTGQALALLEPAAIDLADLSDEPALVALRGQLARAYMFHDDNERAVEVADETLRVAERLDLVPIVADTLITKGTSLTVSGRAYEGDGAIRAGLQLAERYGLGETALRGHINLSTTINDPRGGLETARVGLVLARRLGRAANAIVLLGNASGNAIATGDWEWASRELQEAIEAPLEDAERALLLGAFATLQALRADPFDAHQRELERLFESRPDLENLRSTLHEIRAFAALAAGRLGEAYDEAVAEASVSALSAPLAYILATRAALWDRHLGRATEAVAGFKATGVHGQTADLHQRALQAGLAALSDRRGEALTLYREALRGWRDADLPWDEALTTIDAATLIGPDDPEVRDAAIRSRDILVRLGARPFVERLDNAMRGAATEARGEPVSAPPRSSDLS